MAFGLSSWAVDGSSTSAREARLQLESATRGGNGVVYIGGNLHVTPDPAGASNKVRIRSGGIVANGHEYFFQGSYYDYNVGDELLEIPGNNTNQNTYYAVRAQVEDPTWQGSPWNHNPRTDPVTYFRTHEVNGPHGRGAEQRTYVSLATVLVPANTQTPSITDADIFDNRRPVEPITQILQDTQQSGGAINSGDGGRVNQSGWENWPHAARWDVYIPTWAHAVDVAATITGADHDRHNSHGFYAFRCSFLPAQGPDRVDFGYTNLYVGNTNDRQTIGCGGTVPIPPEYRDHVRRFVLQARRTDGQAVLSADKGTTTQISIFLKQWRGDWLQAVPWP